MYIWNINMQSVSESDNNSVIILTDSANYSLDWFKLISHESFWPKPASIGGICSWFGLHWTHCLFFACSQQKQCVFYYLYSFLYSFIKLSCSIQAFENISATSCLFSVRSHQIIINNSELNMVIRAAALLYFCKYKIRPSAQQNACYTNVVALWLTQEAEANTKQRVVKYLRINTKSEMTRCLLGHVVPLYLCFP